MGEEEDQDKKAIDEVEKEEREENRRGEKERSGEKKSKDGKDGKDRKDRKDSKDSKDSNAQNKAAMTQQQMIMIGAAVLLVCGVGYWYYTKDDAGGSGSGGNIVATDCSAQEATITSLTGKIQLLEATNSEIADDLKDSETLSQKRLGDTIGVAFGLGAVVSIIGGYYFKTNVLDKRKDEKGKDKEKPA